MEVDNTESDWDRLYVQCRVVMGVHGCKDDRKAERVGNALQLQNVGRGPKRNWYTYQHEIENMSYHFLLPKTEKGKEKQCAYQLYIEDVMDLEWNDKNKQITKLKECSIPFFL